jgi:aspartyl-tRNA(Asn)/glutamyl-tRNA(Gln) amidotransferase subunit A
VVFQREAVLLKTHVEKFDYISVRDRILSGEISCFSLTERSLKRISEHADLNAFISVFKSRAITRANEIDDKITQGRGGRLAGMIVAIKDNFNINNTLMTCGSRILKNYISPYDATVIERLEREDAIIIGKTNMDEFGMGSSNENSYFGPVKNPHDTGRTTGGSSGGSACAVSSGMTMTALGSDTGGSVRQPAAMAGVIGLRPTYGRISRYGLVAFASSLDQVGIISNKVSDCAKLLNVIAGWDYRDSTSLNVPVGDYISCLKSDIKGLKVGIPGEFFSKGLSEKIEKEILQIVNSMQKYGAEIINISLPHTKYAIAAYYIIANAEASSNLARYDGTGYGCRSKNVHDVNDMYVETRNQGFGKEVKRRIMLGTYVLSKGYFQAYYQKAQKVRTLIRKDFYKAFNKCDVILSPTTPTTAFRIGEKSEDSLSMYLSDIYTVSSPLSGVPSISVPAGNDSSGLPIGVQITGKPLEEGRILNTAFWIEKNLEN